MTNNKEVVVALPELPTDLTPEEQEARETWLTERAVSAKEYLTEIKGSPRPEDRYATVSEICRYSTISIPRREWSPVLTRAWQLGFRFIPDPQGRGYSLGSEEDDLPVGAAIKHLIKPMQGLLKGLMKRCHAMLRGGAPPRVIKDEVEKHEIQLSDLPVVARLSGLAPDWEDFAKALVSRVDFLLTE